MRHGEKNIISLRIYAKKVNLYVAISARGKTSLKVFTHNTNSELYVKTLKEKLSEIKNWREELVLQYDNDLKHKNKLTSDFLKKTNIAYLEWPLYSLELNPI